MSENKIIKSCPFCGSNKNKVERKGENLSGNRRKLTYSVRCNSCHARGSTVSGIGDSHMYENEFLKSIAIDKWNERSKEN